MPRGRGKGGYGPKKSHKGQRRHFTDADELREQMEREEKKKEWRRQQGKDSDESDEEDQEENKGRSSHGAPGELPPSDSSEDSDESDEEDQEENKGRSSHGAPGELPPSDSSEESDSDDDSKKKAKGVEHLIEIENPNRAGGRTSKKISELQDQEGAQLSRREREELEKQQAKVRYQKLHMEGKTEEARADLARLAIIRKQREEAAKKREEERKAQEAKEKKK